MLLVVDQGHTGWRPQWEILDPPLGCLSDIVHFKMLSTSVNIFEQKSGTFITLTMLNHVP